MKLWRWQREIKPENPSILSQVKDVKGDIIGRIIIIPDGTFVGKIESEGFHSVILRTAELGYIDGIVMYPSVLPAKPPWKKAT